MIVKSRRRLGQRSFVLYLQIHQRRPEFDVTSMLDEWTLEISQPDAEYVPHYLIRLNADGTMNFRAEDGSWLDYTYTIDATHFSFTYTGTGLSSSGTYVIDGDKLIFSEENDVN